MSKAMAAEFDTKRLALHKNTIRPREEHRGEAANEVGFFYTSYN